MRWTLSKLLNAMRRESVFVIERVGLEDKEVRLLAYEAQTRGLVTIRIVGLDLWCNLTESGWQYVLNKG